MDKSPQYSFAPVDAALKCLSSKDRKDQLLQYNLDKNLQITKCRFTGPVPKTSSDYDQLIAELLSSSVFLSSIGASDNTSTSVLNNAEQLRLTITSMTFFDKLNESPGKKTSQVRVHRCLTCTHNPFNKRRCDWSWRYYQGMLR